MDFLQESLTPKPAVESYSDAAVFLQNPAEYLHSELDQAADKDAMFTSPISTGGTVYAAIEKMCSELSEVNAYTDALDILSCFRIRLNTLSRYVDSTEDQMVIQDTVSSVDQKIIELKKRREEYSANRAGVLAKYEDIVRSCRSSC